MLSQQGLRWLIRQSPLSFELELIDRSGLKKPVITTTTILPGTKVAIISLIDITQRKSAEEALRYNEALLRKVLEILPVGVWIVDKDSRIISGNPEGSAHLVRRKIRGYAGVWGI